MAAERRWTRVRTPRDLGKFIAQVRVTRGLNQDELADRLGIGRKYIYAIESARLNLYNTRLFDVLRELDIALVAETEVPGPKDPQ